MLGREEQNEAFKGLDDQARKLESISPGPRFEAYVDNERANSTALGGRSVSGWEADVLRVGNRVGSH